MKYANAFDRLGNPIARRVRFVWLRRITESCEAEGIFIIAGSIIILAIIGLWLSGWSFK